MSKYHVDLLYITLAAGCAVTGAIFDLKSRRIPNRLTFPAMLAGLLLHLVLNGIHGLGFAAASGLIAGAIFAIFWLAGGMGAVTDGATDHRWKAVIDSLA